MKSCPICGAPLVVKAQLGFEQDLEGNWKICGVSNANDLNTICENPVNEAVCPNTLCGNAYIYSDPSKLILVYTIPYDPDIGMVAEEQLKDYYYSVVNPRAPGNIPNRDEAYEHWKLSCVDFEPWSGTLLEALDI
jgi:hypothetical protein